MGRTYPAPVAADVFRGYEQSGYFDEVFPADGTGRAHYEDVVARIRKLSSTELSRRERLRDDAFRAAGITFMVYGEDEASSGRSRWTSCPASSRRRSGRRSSRVSCSA